MGKDSTSFGQEAAAPGGYGTAGVEAPGQMIMTQELKCLQKMNVMQVQEKASVVEAVTALLGAEVEMANKYRILDGEGQEVFYAVEKTGCLTRNAKSCCCLADCLPWDLDIYYTEGGANSLAYTLQRPCTYTCCCLNRPVVEMADGEGLKLGSIRDPFACCDITFSMRDAQDNDTIQARGGCCQWGLCCPLPCGPCSKVQFDLGDAVSGKPVGSMEKQVPSCCKFLFASDVDNYKVDMGMVVDPRQKALLMALAIFVDFRYFSDNKNDN